MGWWFGGLRNPKMCVFVEWQANERHSKCVYIIKSNLWDTQVLFSTLCKPWPA